MAISMKCKRFATEAEARDFAARLSNKKGEKRTFYVTESPSEEHPDKRWVVDDDRMLHGWERRVAAYTGGKIDDDA